MAVVGGVIDNTKPEWEGFPDSLNGEIFAGFGGNGKDKTGGYLVKPNHTPEALEAERVAAIRHEYSRRVLDGVELVELLSLSLRIGVFASKKAKGQGGAAEPADSAVASDAANWLGQMKGAAELAIQGGQKVEDIVWPAAP